MTKIRKVVIAGLVISIVVIVTVVMLAYRLPPEPISQEEAIAKVKASVIEMRKGTITEQNIRINEMELRPPTEDEVGLIQEWYSITGVDKEPPELIWKVYITQLFIDVGPRGGIIILDAYTGETIYGVLED